MCEATGWLFVASVALKRIFGTERQTQWMEFVVAVPLSPFLSLVQETKNAREKLATKQLKISLPQQLNCNEEFAIYCIGYSYSASILYLYFKYSCYRYFVSYLGTIAKYLWPHRNPSLTWTPSRMFNITQLWFKWV